MKDKMHYDYEFYDFIKQRFYAQYNELVDYAT